MTPEGPDGGEERLDRAAELLRAEPVPDPAPAVDRVVRSLRRRRRSRPLLVSTADLGAADGVVTVAEDVLVDAVRASGDAVPQVLVTRVRVRREDLTCTGLEVQCAAVYGTDLTVAGRAVAQAAAAAALDVLGPGAPTWREVDVAVVDVLER